MPYAVILALALSAAGWQAKIYDAEGPEEPHVSIFKKGRKWRVSLRTGKFLDDGDKWSQIDTGVKAAIENDWKKLIVEWDSRFGKFNPVFGKKAKATKSKKPKRQKRKKK